MKKIKEGEGITLVALIITIVVLLILAAVAIGTVKDGDIIGYAKNAAGSFNQAKNNELDALAKYESELKEYQEKIDLEEIIRIVLYEEYVLGKTESETYNQYKDILASKLVSFDSFAEHGKHEEGHYLYINTTEGPYFYYADFTKNELVTVKSTDTRYEALKDVKERIDKARQIFAVGNNIGDFEQEVINPETYGSWYLLNLKDKLGVENDKLLMEEAVPNLLEVYFSVGDYEVCFQLDLEKEELTRDEEGKCIGIIKYTQGYAYDL